jgi:hypothetical protein
MHGLGIGFGLGLIVMGPSLFVASRRKRAGTAAANGSVAVGGHNSGPIFNANVNHSVLKSGHSGGHTITIVAILVELAGIAVTLWHTHHLLVAR